MQTKDRNRRILLAVAVLRAVLAIIAVPLAPWLYEDHFVGLVFLRPTKEVFLAGGFLAREGNVNPVMIFLAALPLAIGGVWLFYVLGRLYSSEIRSGDLPGIAGRLLRPDRIEALEEALEKRGPKLVFLGRLAVLSSAAVAAAAGAARLEPRRFLPVDLAGGVLSIVYTITAGYLLGGAYEEAGPWLTAIGVAALLGFAYVLGRSLKRS